MKRTFFVPITTFFLLSACGGGGGHHAHDSPEPTLEITSDNAVQVSKIASEAAFESQQLDDAGGGGFFFIGSAQGIISKFDGHFATSAKIDNGGPGNSVSQVPIPQTTRQCAVSGTETTSGEIADPLTPTLTAGDFFLSEYSACDDGLGEVKNGVVRMDIDAFSGDLLSQLELFSITMTLTLTNLQVSTFADQLPTATEVSTSNGSVTISMDGSNLPFMSITISGDSMVVDTLASSQSLTNFASAFTVDGNFFPSPYTMTMSGTLDSTQLAGIIRYSTPILFEGLGDDDPNSGEFLVEGLNSSLRLIAVNNVDVRIEIDLGADGTVDATINTTWAELDGVPL